MDRFQELIDQIKGKTVDHIVANKETNTGFDIVFTDGSVLELYAKEFGWIFQDKK